MKPLIIFEFDTLVERENIQKFEEALRHECKEGGSLDGYNCIVLQGDMKVSVHYPHKPISYYFNKLKAWLILKIWKRKKFSNTSVIL